MKDELYKDPHSKIEKFTFSSEVSRVFDDMITRSVPGYRENLSLTADLIFRRYHNDERIVDLGSSTGALAEALCARFGKRPFRYIGIDNSESMIEKAHKRLGSQKREAQIEFKTGDIRNMLPEKFSVAVSSYTLQFIPPKERLELLKGIYRSLLPGGTLLFSEKVVEESSELTALLQEVHHEFKRENGYSELEISQKRDAIEEVLIPLSDKENLEMAQKAGFEAASIYLKMINFSSYLAVKQ